MAKPTSRDEFVQHCLRRLGHPVIKINVDSDQIADRVDDAVQKFHNWHMDGTKEVFLKVQVDQLDIDNEYFDIAEEIIYITQLIHMPSGNFSEFSAERQLALQSLNSFTSSGGLVGYNQLQSSMSLLDWMFNEKTRINFNRHTDKLFLPGTNFSADFSVGDFIIADAYESLDGTTYPDIWNDEWLKKYATAMIKEQWGNNLSKFTNVQLPGGIELDGATIKQEAKDEITELDEELKLKYTAPEDFFMG